MINIFQETMFPEIVVSGFTIKLSDAQFLRVLFTAMFEYELQIKFLPKA